MITCNLNYKEPDLTIDLNLLRGNPPASIKYVGNQNQLNLISITVIFQLFSPFTASTTHVVVSILRCETVDFHDLTGYKYLKEERFLQPYLILRGPKTTYFY